MKSLFNIRKFVVILFTITFLIKNREAFSQENYNIEETKFIGIIGEAKQNWINAPNDIQREKIPSNRNKLLCSVKRNINEWTGTVEHINAYMMSDEISFGVKIAENITLRTEGDLQNEESKIQRGTSLFNGIENLAVGQKVVFSGFFLKGEDTCLNETSFTNTGSIKNPEFEFQFKTVKLQE